MTSGSFRWPCKINKHCLSVFQKPKCQRFGHEILFLLLSLKIACLTKQVTKAISEEHAMTHGCRCVQGLRATLHLAISEVRLQAI